MSACPERSSLHLWFGSYFYRRGIQANSFPFGTVEVLLWCPLACISSERNLLALFLLCNGLAPSGCFKVLLVADFT